MANTRCRCGGGPVHHQSDIACWCPRCLRQPTDQRCTAYAPQAPVPLPAPPTDQSAPAASDVDHHAAPEAHGAREAILRQVCGSGSDGATCGEIAALLNVSSKAVATHLARLHAANDVVLSPVPRTVGSATEDVWLPLRPADSFDHHQGTLWA